MPQPDHQATETMSRNVCTGKDECGGGGAYDYTPTQLQEVEQDGHGACRVQSMETTGSCRSLTRYITCRLPG